MPMFAMRTYNESEANARIECSQLPEPVSENITHRLVLLAMKTIAEGEIITIHHQKGVLNYYKAFVKNDDEYNCNLQDYFSLSSKMLYIDSIKKLK